MPTPTYTPLANITLGSSAASVTFSSISQAYRDLVLVVQAATGSANTNLRIRLNSDSGANYNFVTMAGSGSATASTSSAGDTLFAPGYPNYDLGTGLSDAIIHFMDYSATDKHKSMLARTDRPDAQVTAAAGRWASTSAVTGITVYVAATTFNAGTSLALFGIAA